MSEEKSRKLQPVGAKAIEFKVELYNWFRPGNRFPTNGWLVARYIDNCRAETIKPFEGDEKAARRFCTYLNDEFGVRKS